MKNLLISIVILALLVFLFSRFGVVETETEQEPDGGIPILQGDGIVIVGDGDLVVYEQSPATGRVRPFRLLMEGYTLWDIFRAKWRRR